MSQRKRKTLTLTQRIEVLKLLFNNDKASAIAEKYGVSEAAVFRIKRERADIMNDWGKNENPDQRRKHGRRAAEVDVALLNWFNEACCNHEAVNRSVLLEKANQIAKHLGIMKFVATSGWLKRWKMRNNITFPKQQGEKQNTNNCRKTLTITQRIEVLKLLCKNEKACDVAKKYGVSEAAVARIRRKRADIMKDWVKSRNPNQKRKRVRHTAEVEVSLLSYFNEARSKNIHVSGLRLREKANQIAKDLGMVNFVVTSGWLERWKGHNNITLKKQQEEKEIAEDHSAESLISEHFDVISDQNDDKKDCDDDDMSDMTSSYPHSTSNHSSVTSIHTDINESESDTDTDAASEIQQLSGMEFINEIKEENDEEKSDFKIIDSYSMNHMTSSSTDAHVSGDCHTDIKVEYQIQKDSIKEEKHDEFSSGYSMNDMTSLEDEETRRASNQLLDFLLQNMRQQSHGSPGPAGQINSMENITSLDFDQRMATSHTSTENTCPVCLQCFNTFDNLKIHIQREHEENKHFHCTKCEKSFERKIRLDDHIRRVHGEKKYKCDFCEYRATEYYIVKRHELTNHTANKKSPRKKSKRVKNVQNHAQIESVEVLNEHCDECGKSFINRTRLSDHIRRIHSEKRFKCEMCDYSTRENYILKRHYQAVHNVLAVPPPAVPVEQPVFVVLLPFNPT